MEDLKQDNTVPTAPVVEPVKPVAPNDNLFASLAYFPMLFVITMLQKGKDEYHVWHAKNGAGLFLASLALYVLIQIVAGIMPVSIIAMVGLIVWIVDLAILGAIIYGAWNAWNGNRWHIPFVTDLAQKLPLEQLFNKSETSVVETPIITTPVMEATQAPVETPVMVTPVVEPTPVETPVEPTMPEAPVEAPVEPEVLVEEPVVAPTPVEPTMPEPAVQEEPTVTPAEPTVPPTV
ncbi:MAG: hypothetical protein WC897_03590 [Candidatus Gracilibacteria bacterium]